MKLARWLWAVVLIGMCSPWAGASQTPIDPKLIINRGTGYPDCSFNPSSSSTPTCLTGNTIVEPFNNGVFSFDFAYVNTSDNLSKLFIIITGVPEGTPYSCQSDIWRKCKIKTPKPDIEDGDVEPIEYITMTFVLSGKDGTHTGFIPKLLPGGSPATFGVDQFVPSATPEPGTWVLFATGIFAFALIGFGRKRAVATPLT